LSLAGIRSLDQTRSGTLIARPGQDVPSFRAKSKNQGDKIIPQEITLKFQYFTNKQQADNHKIDHQLTYKQISPE
jgi:hypothetical protein